MLSQPCFPCFLTAVAGIHNLTTPHLNSCSSLLASPLSPPICPPAVHIFLKTSLSLVSLILHLKLLRINSSSWLWPISIFLIWSWITFLLSFPALPLNHSELQPQWISFRSLNQCFLLFSFLLGTVLHFIYRKLSYISFKNQIKISLSPWNFSSFSCPSTAPSTAYHMTADFIIIKWWIIHSDPSTHRAIVKSSGGDPQPPSFQNFEATVLGVSSVFAGRIDNGMNEEPKFELLCVNFIARQSD